MPSIRVKVRVMPIYLPSGAYMYLNSLDQIHHTQTPSLSGVVKLESSRRSFENPISKVTIATTRAVGRYIRGRQKLFFFVTTTGSHNGSCHYRGI